MYAHAHVQAVFSITDPSVRTLHGCPSCYTTVVIRDGKPKEVIK
jgi:competence CoiA-like predicted nuclease